MINICKSCDQRFDEPKVGSYCQDCDDHIIQMMPPGGWVEAVTFTEKNRPIEVYDNMVGWGLTKSGRVVPLSLDYGSGAVMEFDANQIAIKPEHVSDIVNRLLDERTRDEIATKKS